MASYGEPKQDVAAVVAKQMLAMARDAEKQYAAGYRAGRIAALREVGCLEPCACDDEPVDCTEAQPPYETCRRCRLLAEAESGEDAAEVGDDR